MAITDRDELLAAIADYLARSDLTSAIPDFVTLAESRINYGAGEPGEVMASPPLRVQQMLTRSTATLSSEYLAHPTDLLEVRTFKINTNPETKLYYSTPDQFAEAHSSYTVGTPRTFTIAGSEFRFGPAPSEVVTTELWYYAKVPALTASATTNWLLTAAPNIYLYGALLESAPYIGNDERMGLWAGLFSAALKGFQAQDRRAKYGSSPLIMRPVTATP